MALPKFLITVTTFSKYLAMALFILFPFVGFFLGMQFQKLTQQQSQSLISNFVDCKNAGYPVIYSYPAQCRTPDGKVFIENMPTPLPTTAIKANPTSCSDCPSRYNFCQNKATKQTSCVNSAIMAPQSTDVTCTFCRQRSPTVTNTPLSQCSPTAQKGALEGHLVTQDGDPRMGTNNGSQAMNPVQGMQVDVRDSQGNLIASPISDNNGMFCVLLPQNSYTVLGTFNVKETFFIQPGKKQIVVLTYPSYKPPAYPK